MGAAEDAVRKRLDENNRRKSATNAAQKSVDGRRMRELQKQLKVEAKKALQRLESQGYPGGRLTTV